MINMNHTDNTTNIHWWFKQVWRWLQQRRWNKRGRGRCLISGRHVRGVRSSGHFIGGASRYRIRATTVWHVGNKQQLRGGQHDARHVQHDFINRRGHIHVRRRHGSVVSGGRRSRRSRQLDGQCIRFHGRRIFGSVFIKYKSLIVIRWLTILECILENIIEECLLLKVRLQCLSGLRVSIEEFGERKGANNIIKSGEEITGIGY